jgi:hypothetical protein
MNLRLVHLLLALALLWRGLIPAGVMAMPGESGFEVRLCGLNGGTVVLDFGTGEADPQPAMDHGSQLCPLCASVAGVALPSTVHVALPERVIGQRLAQHLVDAAPRGPPLQPVARGPPQLI